MALGGTYRTAVIHVISSFRRVLLSSLCLAAAAGLSGVSRASAEDWRPEWETLEIPELQAPTFVARGNRSERGSEDLVWVFIDYGELRPISVSEGARARSELQEWYVSCGTNEASVATIRWSRLPAPNLQLHGVTHPNGNVDPNSEQVASVCRYLRSTD